MEDLVDKFSIERIHKGGAKFDFEKAKWFNHEWIRRLDVEHYEARVREIFETNGIAIVDEHYLHRVMGLIKDRCTLLPDFYTEGLVFFKSPAIYDEPSVKAKWDEVKKEYFIALIDEFGNLPGWDAVSMEQTFKSLASLKNIKAGELQMIFRIMLVGSKTGPALFVIAETIGKEETITRVKNALQVFG
ncbi:MAG: hypothetical protein ABIS01_10695 [Ferruginibacter sp.]